MMATRRSWGKFDIGYFYHRNLCPLSIHPLLSNYLLLFMLISLDTTSPIPNNPMPVTIFGTTTKRYRPLKQRLYIFVQY